MYTQEIWLRIIAVVAGGNRNTLCIKKLIHVASSNTLWEVKVPYTAIRATMALYSEGNSANSSFSATRKDCMSMHCQTESGTVLKCHLISWYRDLHYPG